MLSDWTDYPLSIFTGVARHFIGRIFLLLATLVLAVFLGSGIAVSTGDHIGWFNGIMIYPIMIIGGIAQVWGILVYFALGVFTAVYLQRDVFGSGISRIFPPGERLDILPYVDRRTVETIRQFRTQIYAAARDPSLPWWKKVLVRCIR
jgi:hypothetical protein